MTIESDKNRKVTLLLPSARGGGAERVMIQIANHLARKGYIVELVLVKAEGPFLGEICTQVKVVDLQSQRTFYALPRLAKHIDIEKPDVILSALTHVNIAALIAKLWAGSGVKLIVTEHSNPKKALFSGLKSSFLRLLVKLLYKKADWVVCVSDGIRSTFMQYMKVPKEKLITIYNPLNFDQIHSKMCEPISHPWVSDSSIRLLLAVGRLTKAKDYPTLLKAFARLDPKFNAHLVILGEGEDRRDLEHLASELGISRHVQFFGFNENPYAWMKACDVFVMSSTWEGLPGSLMEALACNAQIVSTDCETGPREVLEGGIWGYLTKVGDPVELCRTIERALTSQRTTIPPSATDRFRPEVVIGRYERLIT